MRPRSPSAVELRAVETGDASARGAAPRCGIGLRSPHVAEVIETRPRLAWVEVHAENWMGGGPAVAQLDVVRRDCGVSLHGVGLSIGSDGRLDRRHLGRLRALVDRLDPCLVSEHLSWSIAGGAYLNHLLPLPYTDEALDVVVRNVSEAQDALGRPLLIENPSSYLRFRGSTMPEPAFLAELVARAGCGILCDVNNVFVSAHNLGFDPAGYLDALPAAAVEEIHLAGHAANEADGHVVLIDDHGSRVPEPVWALYTHAIHRFGGVPTMIEWDTDIPGLATLIDEAATADRHAARAMAREGTAQVDDARAA